MKKLVSLAVSATILALIYWQIDLTALAEAFARTVPATLAVAILMVVPITLLTAWRLVLLVPREGRMGLGQSTSLILAASALNMVLPSKMGDLAKSVFMGRSGALPGTLALSLVVFEKATDMLALLAWCVLGLALYPHKDWFFLVMTAVVGVGLLFGVLMLGSLAFAEFFFGAASRVLPSRMGEKWETLRQSWGEMHGFFWRRRGFCLGIMGLSVFLWFLHLLQIWLFALALEAPIPFLGNIALVPLAILAGLLPLTFAGIGTRDAALILLLRPFIEPATGAALGLLCTLRYLLPALGGLPFLTRYLAELRGTRV
jgi:glycosyltransferase 2 family protein